MTSYVKSIGVGAVAVLLGCALVSAPTYAKAPGSPPSTNLTSDAFSTSNAIFYNPSTGTKRGLGGGAVNHILIESDHGTAESIRLGIYYPVGTTGPQRIDIDSNSNICTGFPNTNDVAITFTASYPDSVPGNPPVSTLIHSVRSRDVCGSGSTFYIKDIIIPATIMNDPRVIDFTMNRKVVTLDIAYTPYVRGLLPKSTDRTVSFKAIAVTGSGRIGTKDANGSANNAIVPKDSGGQGNLQMVYPFGLACTASTSVTGTATLYDADNGIGNQGGYDMYFYIERLNGSNWVPLRENDLTISGAIQVSKASIRRGSGSNPIIYIVPNNGDKDVDASLQVPNLQPFVKYRMVVEDLHKRGNSGNNYIYVGLPGDGIFGSQNFSCPSPYSLEPGVTVSDQFVEAGGSFDVTALIKNTTTSNAGIHAWTIDQIQYLPAEVPKMTAIPGVTPTGSVCPTGFYKLPPSCKTFISGTSDFPAGATEPNIPTPFVVPPTATVGSKFCFVVSVQTSTPPDGLNWKHSAPQCVTIGLKPKLQVWGYDFRTGGSVKTSLSQTNGQWRGSWGEYGVFSNGINNKMASGSGLSGGNPSNVQAAWSALTFANIPSPPYGNYGGIAAPAYKAGAPTTTLLTNTLGAGTYAQNTKGVIYYDGTLTITGNHTYNNGPYGSIAAIPNVKIVAKNIIIAAGVTQIDPWLIAIGDGTTYGAISTCDSVPGFQNFATVSLNSTICNSQLRLNGPVVADQLYPYRTFGSANGDPAEIFNLRATNFLSSYVGPGSDRPVARTELLTDLPPRF